MASNTPVMVMTKRYGNTTYTVNTFCSESSGASFEEKLLELIRNAADHDVPAGEKTADAHHDNGAA